MKKNIMFILVLFSIVFIPFKVNAADPVVKIGDKTYTTLNNAIKAAPSETKTTITVLKDFSENVTIANNKDIILDLNGYTLSNAKDATVITNNGILEIKNGTITSDAGSGMINNNKDAVFVMDSGNLIATGTRQALYNDAGNVTISGSAYLESATEERATLHNKNSGIVTITGGTIVANNSYAIYNEKGTLNIGVKNDAFDKSSPIIQGATYGVVANNKFNFYDGIIKGVTYSIGKTSNTGNTPTVSDDIGETKVEDYEEDSVKELNEEAIDGVTYKTFTYELDNTNRIKIIFDPNGGEINKNYKWMYIGNPIGILPKPSRVNYTFDGWFTSATEGSQINENTKPVEPTTYYAHWTYVDPATVASVEGVEGTMTLKDAFAHGGNITLLKDVIITESLSMDKVSNLDLNGHTISLKNKRIEITEKVTIDDSSENKTGKITSNANFTIIVGEENNPTNGNLTVKGGTIENLGEYGAIFNYETLEIDGGTIQATSNATNGYTVYNLKNLTMKSGTVYSTNRRAIQVYENSTFTMDGGLVKTDSTGEQVVNLYGNCSATINGGTIEGLGNNTAGIAMFGNTNLTVNGGTIKGHAMAIAGNGNEVSGNANITVNGGTMVATDGVGLYLPQRDSITMINGGEISGPTGIEIRAGTLIVNDGNITGTNDTYEVKKNDSGTTTKGAAIAVAQHNTKQPIVVMINGGNLKSVVPLTEVNPQHNPPEALELIEIVVTQGNFESTGDESVKTLDDISIEPFISGGTYTTDPSDYVKDGYGVVPVPEGFEVTEVHNITVDQNSTDLIKLNETKAPYKKKVEIKEIKEKLGYYAKVEVYDTNGNKLDIEVTNNKFIMPDQDVVLKLVYKKMINPETGDNIYLNILLLIISTIGLSVITKKTKRA